MRILVFVHRWLGVFLCLFFSMWFLSGIVMMYVPFPSLSDHERLSKLDKIDTERIVVSPSDAIRKCAFKDITGLRVISISQRPAYICHSKSLPVIAVYADDATLVNYTKNTEPAMYGPFDYDQWVVHQKFDPYRPFYRIDINDAEGSQAYISTRTGEVLQQTNRQERAWNYLGSVAHWIYPTILRKHWSAWDQSVWWLSLAATISVIIGLYLGVAAALRAVKSSSSGLSPYRGWISWHHVFGLFSGIFVLSWIFSGWLSMDHGRFFSSPDPEDIQLAAFRGKNFTDITAEYPITELHKIMTTKEISFHAVGGFTFLQLKDETSTRQTRSFSEKEVLKGINMAWPHLEKPEWLIVPDEDSYTSLREGKLPEGSYRVMLADPMRTWVHINPNNGGIISVMNRSRRLYRWLYNGLHSLDFPCLANRRPLWDVVMLILLLGGGMFSMTGIVVALRYVRVDSKRNATLKSEY